jgi:hypothetical protein
LTAAELTKTICFTWRSPTDAAPQDGCCKEI